MTRTTKTVSTVGKREVVAAVVCDRCGADGRCSNASAERGWLNAGPWGVVRGLIQGGDAYSADLCHDCTDDLLQWLDNGAGEGAQR